MLKASIPYVTLHVEKDFSLFGNQNEFEQVILNLLNNAKEAIQTRSISEPKIEIKINAPKVTVTDNAGGIDEKELNQIFEPYHTTKENNDGIGLYIAKTIIQNELKGRLHVENIQDGARFEMVFLGESRI